MMFAQNLGQNIGSALGAYRKRKVEQGVANVMSNPNYDNQTRFEKLQEIPGWADTEAGKVYQEYQMRMAQQQEQEQRIRGSAISYLSQDGTDPSMFEHVPTEALRSVASKKFAQSYMQPTEEDILNIRSKRLDIQGKRLRNERYRQDITAQGEPQTAHTDVLNNYKTIQGSLNSLYKQLQDAENTIWEDDNSKAAFINRINTEIQNMKEIADAMLQQLRQQYGVGNTEQTQQIPEHQKEWEDIMAKLIGNKSSIPGEEAQTEGEFFVPGEQAWIEGKRPTDKQNVETNEEYLKRLKFEAMQSNRSMFPALARRQQEKINTQLTAAGLKRGMSKAQIDSIINESETNQKPVDINKILYQTIDEFEPDDIEKAYAVYRNKLIVKDAAMSIEEFIKKAEKDPEFLWQHYKRRNPYSKIKESLSRQNQFNMQGGMLW
jgi:hypothetical protein